MANAKKVNIFGKDVILSERFSIDVFSNVYPVDADNIKLFWWASQVVSDSIKAGLIDKFLGKLRAKYYSPKRLLKRLPVQKIEELFEIVFYELEKNERTDSKKKQETIQAE